MKKRNLWSISPIVIIITAALVVQAIIMAFISLEFFIAGAAVALVGIMLLAFNLRRIDKSVKRYILSLSHDLNSPGSGLLAGFNMPILITRKSGEIIWYNEAFTSAILNYDDKMGENYDFIINGVSAEILKDRPCDITYNDRHFKVFQSISETNIRFMRILYFFDESELFEALDSLRIAKPAVSIISVDNLDEIAGSLRERERAVLIGEIEDLLDQWLVGANYILRRMPMDKFLLIAGVHDTECLIEEKFEILESVKAVTIDDNPAGLTLSIGIGMGDNIAQSDEFAANALDMALGRGGDQAVVKNMADYQFFGGISKATERRTKVRARVIASSLKQLIKSSQNVLIMGHKSADLDSLGSAYALFSTCINLEKDVKIVMTKEGSMALPLAEKLQSEHHNAIIEPVEALNLINDKTLLIIVDTHLKDLLDSPEVYENCQTIVIIDHHRRKVDYINNAVIFYHEPYASSTAELVTEVLQYMNDEGVSPLAAQALLSGIMLDTNNFLLRTNTRTFEAAAYLHAKGADPSHIHEFFCESAENLQMRSSILSSSKIVEDFALSIVSGGDSMKLAASQAADELLAIKDVKASFVIFENRGDINVSARSKGLINVQIIMEMLGGGGHQTMSAAQFENSIIEEVEQKLLESIKKYKEDYATN